MGVPLYIFNLDGAVGAGDVAQFGAPRNMDNIFRAHVSMVGIRMSSLYLDHIAGARSFDFQIVQKLLALGVFGAGDVNGVLIPTGDFNRAVEILHRQASAGGLRIAVMKIFAVPGTVGGAEQGGSAQSEDQGLHKRSPLSIMDAIQPKMLGPIGAFSNVAHALCVPHRDSSRCLASAT